ncbi:MAG: hypothetical protein ACI9LM_001253 [Alteromonadaceae bacterium]|jgi:hypothetical protein
MGNVEGGHYILKYMGIFTIVSKCDFIGNLDKSVLSLYVQGFISMGDQFYCTQLHSISLNST